MLPHLASSVFCQAQPGVCWRWLVNVPLSDEDAATLAQSPHLWKLESLRLAFCNIGPAGTVALAASPNLTGLRELSLWNNLLSHEGVKTLAASPHLGMLHTLNEDGTRTGAEAVRALAFSHGLANLRRLPLINNEQSRAAISVFADSVRLPRVLFLATYHREGTGLSALGRPIVV